MIVKWRLNRKLSGCVLLILAGILIGNVAYLGLRRNSVENSSLSKDVNSPLMCPCPREDSRQNPSQPVKDSRNALVLVPDLKVPKEDKSSKVKPRLMSNELTMRDPLFIGVVTAQGLLSTRAMGIYNTWGGRAGKLVFFSSPGDNQGLPVVNLPGVDDTYPPQKKVFMMLKYMYDNYLESYNWFMRSDDDVYVRVERLQSFLSRLDPTEPLYIGSPGFGKPEDRARLKLAKHEHYCMGGPGVIFSRELLRRLGPHLQDCLENVVVSYNEDVELGRCVSRRLGIQCTWSYQASKIFYMDYSKGEVFKSPSVYQHKDLLQALTVHSFKKMEDMQLVHQFYVEIEMTERSNKDRDISSELSKLQKITGRDKAFKL